MIVNGLSFVEYISEKEMDSIIGKLATEVQEATKDKNPLFIVMLNGAFIFASDFLRKLNFPAETYFLKYSSYQGTSSTGEVMTSPISDIVKDRNIVVLEDIVDSGLTMDIFRKELEKKCPKSVLIVSMLSKPQARKVDVKIDYIGREIDNKFVLGMGLDYDGVGRNLKSIYIKEK